MRDSLLFALSLLTFHLFAGELHAVDFDQLDDEIVKKCRITFEPQLSVMEDLIRTQQANIVLLNEKNSKLELELSRARNDVDKCKCDIVREREISGKLMNEKAFLDRLLHDAADLKREKEQLSASLLEKHFENGQLVANASILNAKIVELQNELTRANDEKKKNATTCVEKEDTKYDRKESQEDVIFSGENCRVHMYSLKSGRCLNKFDGVQGATSVELVSNDLLIASSTDFSISLWNLTRNELRASLRGHTSAVISFALLSDKSLASGATDSEIRIWNLESGKCLRSLIHYRSDTYSYAVFALVALPNRKLASGSESGSVKIWNLDNGECLKKLNRATRGKGSSMFDLNLLDSYLDYYMANSTPVYSLVSLPRNRLASGLGDATIQIWSIVNYECLAILKGHSGAVYALLALPDSSALVSASADHTLKRWSLNDVTGEEKSVETLSGHTRQVFSLALVFSGAVYSVASASYDNTIRLWDMKSGQCSRIITNVTSTNRSLGRLSTGCLKFASLQLTNFY